MNCFQHLSGSRGATDKPPRGGATKKKADSTTPHALSASNTHAHHNQAHCTTALAHLPSLLTERATHAHPLHPAALASVPYGIVFVRVRVRVLFPLDTEARCHPRKGPQERVRRHVIIRSRETKINPNLKGVVSGLAHRTLLLLGGRGPTPVI